MTKTYVMAAFNVSKAKSLKYAGYKTIRGLTASLRKVLEELEPDYISIRVVSSDQTD